MPYTIKHEGEKWCVYHADSGKSEGCSSSKEEAEAHIRAMYAHSHDGLREDDLTISTEQDASDPTTHFVHVHGRTIPVSGPAPLPEQSGRKEPANKPAVSPQKPTKPASGGAQSPQSAPAAQGKAAPPPLPAKAPPKQKGKDSPLLSKEKIDSTISRFNSGDGRKDYTDQQWQEIGEKIAEAASKHKGEPFVFENGKVKPKGKGEEGKEETTGKDAADTGHIKIGDRESDGAAYEVQPQKTEAKDREDLDVAASITDPFPSLMEQATGRYQKGVVDVEGFKIAIENPRGTLRNGVEQKYHYGYITKAKGIRASGLLDNDGDKIDAFLGDYPQSGKAYIIDQLHPHDSSFDEHKIVLGARSPDEARSIYLSSYGPHWDIRGLGHITEMGIEAFRAWLTHSDLTRACFHPLNGDSHKKTQQEVHFREAEPGDPAGVPRCANCKYWSSGNTCRIVEGAIHADDVCDEFEQSALPLLHLPNEKEASLEPEADCHCGGTCLKCSGDECEDACAIVSSDWQILSDSKDGLLRVRQLFTIADSINDNNRRYRKPILTAAIAEARPRAHAGAMLMELVHPEVVRTRKGEDKYVDNHDRKSARIDDIHDPDETGRVYGDITVLNTLCGKEVADAYRKGRPYGVSMRFVMRSQKTRVDNRLVEDAEEIHLHTFDHVPNPAVPETKHRFALLNDSLREALHLSAEKTPPETVLAADGQTGAPTMDAAQRRSHIMNQAINKAASNLSALIIRGAKAKEVAAARKTLTDECLLAERAGEDLVGALELCLKMDMAMQQAGYQGDREGPTAIPGNHTGTDPHGEGWGGEIEKNAQKPEGAGGVPPPKGAPGMDEKLLGRLGISEADLKFIRAAREKETKAAEDARRQEEIKTACDAQRETLLKGLTPDQQEYILGIAARVAQDADSVPQVVSDQLDAFMKHMAAERLKGMGHDPNNPASGRTTSDPANPGGEIRVSVQEMHPVFDAAFAGLAGRTPDYLRDVSRICLAADDHCRNNQAFEINPDDPKTQQRRAHNLRKLMPILNDIPARFHGCKDAAEWFARCDTLYKDGEDAFCDSIRAACDAKAASDASTTSEFLNQPVILTALLIQSFWDLNMFQYVQGIGPGHSQGGGGGWFETPIGANGDMGYALRIPIEYVDYAAMSGYATEPGYLYDPQLRVPEGIGIDELKIRTRWKTYAPTWMRIAVAPTRDAIRGMGTGPLNYNVAGRLLFHMGFDKTRRVDKGLGDEMWHTADEVGAVAVTAEEPNLTNNSVADSGGSVVVNLNPAKTADTAPSGADPSITYGVNVVGALRLQEEGAGSATPYFGTAAGTGYMPVVFPRTNLDLTSEGEIESAVQNPFTITQTGGSYNAPHQGYLDYDDMQVKAFAGDTGTPNFAVDFNHGVVVFTTDYDAFTYGGSTLTDAASSDTDIAYSYVTNFDEFIVNNPTLGTGIDLAQYLNGLMHRIDRTAAFMGSRKRFVKPDLLLGDLEASAFVTGSQIFYNWASPKGTNLFPDEYYYAERTGVMFGRTNVPWYPKNERMLLTRQGATKYGIGTPMETRGPQFPFDSNGKPIAQDVYYAQEQNVFATPQVEDVNGTILNPVSREIILR